MPGDPVTTLHRQQRGLQKGQEICSKEKNPGLDKTKGSQASISNKYQTQSLTNGGLD